MSNSFSKDQLLNFKIAFSNRKEQLIKSLNIKNTDELDSEGDEIDVIQTNVLSSVNSVLSKRDMLTLEKLDTALRKIETGEFGACEECGSAVGEKRLLALPGCTECIQCAEKSEKLSRQFI